jgi:ATP-binding cassette subfamily C (CFTR/MRP) protein 4
MFLFTTVASFLSVLFFQEGWFDIDPAVLGLSLSMLTMLAGIFQWCIRQSAEVVNQMVSVERVVAFGEIPPEAELTKNEPDLSLIRNDWPQAGSIVVKNLSVRYRDALPLSLHKVSFHIKPGHRVGVVGRTGSGKSTLVQSLFRLLEAEEGCILVDEVDISTVGLHTLRNKMSVIPQFPVLFSGCTVRENLDPFHKHSDESVRDALRDVHMDHALEDLPRGWNSMVSEGGSNFSVGQRQLLCLARAILCKNKILVLDEPTANVDRRTDQLLQEALQKSFKGATIFSVAHRLDTVIEYDEILVLGGGELLEYGSPSKLLEQSDGHFSSMVRDTGDLMSQDLRRRATQVHQEMTREIP